MDYSHYLQYLKIIWKRIKEEYSSSIDCGLQMTNMLNARQENSDQFRMIFIQYEQMLTVLQCDIEAFIVFARIFLDKVGKLVEALIKSPNRTNNFWEHKKFFIERTDLNSAYSRLLKDETNWYAQDLLLWRNEILVHGNTLSTGCLVSPSRGIRFIKSIGLFPISDKDKARFYKIKEKYKQQYPDLKITENPYTMVEEFREEIAKHNIKIDRHDLVELGKIVSNKGTSLDILQIARQLKDFTESAAATIKP